MMKKVTAYMFILLANIFLLAHAVLPHHHHQLQFCIENSHCHHHNVPDPLDRAHDHDGDNSSDCILKQLIISQANPVRQECACTTPTDGPFNFHDWHAVDLYHGLQSFAFLKAKEVAFPSPTSAYTLLIPAASGLRAPPAV